MTPEEQICFINTMMQRQNESLDCIRRTLTSLNDKLRLLVDSSKWLKARYETTLTRENAIAANKVYLTPSVANQGFNRCRLEIAANFTEATNAGVGVQMVYGNSPIGKIFDMVSSNGAAIMRSEPIDVKELNAFQFEIHNRDVSNAVTLRNVKVILYNDW